MIKNESSGTARPNRDGLAGMKGSVVAVTPSTPEEEQQRAEAVEATRRSEHPTRREDRPPNPRSAEEALARDLGLEGKDMIGEFFEGGAGNVAGRGE